MKPNDMTMKRRQFLKTGALGTLAGGMATSQSIQAGVEYNEEILVYMYDNGLLAGTHSI